jgi:hypothetical protein
MVVDSGGGESTMTTTSQFVLALLTCSLMACTGGKAGAQPEAGTGGDGTSGSAGADSATGTDRDSAGPSSDGAMAAMGADATALSCTEQVASCPAFRSEEWKVLLDAKSFGDSARFVALGGHAVIVDTGSSGFQVVWVLDAIQATSTRSYTAWKVPNGATQPVAVAEGELQGTGGGQSTVIVLVCNEARMECSLWRGDASQDELSPWSGTALPGDFVARDMVFDSASSPPAACVYGNGLICFRDVWHAEIPASADLRLNHVAISSAWSIAAGEQGRWFRRERDAAWIEQPPLGAVSLSWASTADLGGVIIGEGRIQAAFGTQSEFYGCAVPRDLAALILVEGSRGVAFAVTQSGEILQHAPWQTIPPTPHYCSKQQLPEGGILGIDTAPCRDSTNPRLLLNGSLLLGLNLCVVI